MKRLTAIVVALTMIITTTTVLSAKDSYMDLCEKVGNEFCVSPDLLYALAEHESGLDPNAVGSAGDTGLCQIIPKYNRDRMRRLGVTNLKDPEQNLRVAADILLERFEKYEDPILVLMTYNMGEAGGLRAYDRGKRSSYALEILERAYEVEEINGKHDY